MRHLVCAILLGLIPTTSFAHKASDSYLTLRADEAVAHISGQWDIALRDLDFAIGIDANGDGEITWGEVKARHEQIASYAIAHLSLSALGSVCRLHIGEHLIAEHSDGAYAVLRFIATCSQPVDRMERLDIEYRALFDLDSQHRGLLRFEHHGSTRTAILSPEQPRVSLEIGDRAADQRPYLAELLQYMREGVWHIWIGFDHILFLLSLLLPAVLILRSRVWDPVAAFRPAFWEVFRIVTSFTLAHSITLTLATLEVVSLPSRLVESAIALSVVLAAANNVYPLIDRSRWMVAFVFGLIHGFGFATVLGELGLRSSTLLTALIGFNLGVEIGQLAIVLVFLPIAYWVRATWTYRRMVVQGGSVAIIVVATIWFCERAFNLALLPT
jgi:HupE / UreJ protein